MSSLTIDFDLLLEAETTEEFIQLLQTEPLYIHNPIQFASIFIPMITDSELFKKCEFLGQASKDLHIWDGINDFCIEYLENPSIIEVLKKDKKLLMQFISIYFKTEKQFDKYLKLKEYQLVECFTEDEFIHKTKQNFHIYFDGNIIHDYLNDKNINNIRKYIFDFIQNGHYKNKEHTDKFRRYTNYCIFNEFITLQELIDHISPLPKVKDKLFLINHFWYFPQYEEIIEHKEFLISLIEDKPSQIRKHDIYKDIFCRLSSHYWECAIFSSFTWVFGFENLIENNTDKEIIDMLNKFKIKHPNIFSKMYMKNHIMKKSKKKDLKAHFERIHILMNIEEDFTKEGKRKRI